MQKAVLLFLALQFAESLKVIKPPSASSQDTVTAVTADKINVSVIPTEPEQTAFEKEFPATSKAVHRHHHKGGQGYEKDQVEKNEHLGFLGWATFVGVITFGVLAEIFGLKTWEGEVDVKTACTALAWWMLVAAFFCGFLSYQNSHVYTWIDGYILEVMLSFDNLFVFVLIMDSFRIPSVARNRILLLSVIYCFACRLAMFEAIAALKSFATIVTQVLGVFIAYCAYKVMMMDDDEDEDFANSPAIQFLSSFFPVTTQVDDRGSFFIDNKATASFLGLIALIVFDTIFAVDSVSAKSALIESTFINFTSSGFAMVMLRAAYFLLDNAVDMFSYLKYGIGIILFIIAFMAIFPGLVPISNFQYCLLLMGILGISITVSVMVPPSEEEEDEKDETGSVANRLRLSESSSNAGKKETTALLDTSTSSKA
eukprot:gnl/MRDRNA2_/MRDRNA2_29893_c0_seq1.p1 gnl/MRDRNA2_/MRDRNA2_29893_c0~~gnl/MRDRNA2_/MRDRNA2_29893_c0_seq1.p1  ORF type:complete len:426 (+),score=89.08 gnl/MRDRNA2_/MRDRNA2_29893_c0_seq1:99-1376(+)